jgi:hypothetical protein
MEMNNFTIACEKSRFTLTLFNLSATPSDSDVVVTDNMLPIIDNALTALRIEENECKLFHINENKNRKRFWLFGRKLTLEELGNQFDADYSVYKDIKEELITLKELLNKEYVNSAKVSSITYKIVEWLDMRYTEMSKYIDIENGKYASIVYTVDDACTTHMSYDGASYIRFTYRHWFVENDDDGYTYIEDSSDLDDEYTNYVLNREVINI